MFATFRPPNLGSASRARGVFGLAAMIAVSAACSTSPRLSVNVATGLVPGPEFAYVVTEVFDPRPAADGAEAIARAPERIAQFGESYSRGRSAAVFDALPLGELTVRVRLLRPDHSLLIERRTRVSFNASFVLTVHLTRDCVSVSCPAPGGSPAFTECLAGECVDPRCTTITREFCPPALFCNDDTACNASAACAAGICADGICEEEILADSCGDTQYCNPDEGCEPLVVRDIDAGLLDGGPLDAADDDASDSSRDGGFLDGASEASVDAAIVCDTVCVSPDYPCFFGVWDCSGAAPACAPTWTKRAGSNCGSGRVCDPYGSCIACEEGAACLFDCLEGTLSCVSGAAQCTPVEPAHIAPVGSSCLPFDVCAGGTSCGGGYVCSAEGTCVSCVEDADCNVGCATGHTSCAAGGTCVLGGGHLATGALCELGDGQESHCTAGGACVNCTQGGSCDSGATCRAGQMDCSTGAGACIDMGFSSPGAACTTGVCSGAGSCFSALVANDVSAGATHTCAIRASDNLALCWGGNNRGEVGSGVVGDSAMAVKTQLPGLVTATTVHAAFDYTLVYGRGFEPMSSMLSDVLVGFGANSYGQLADGTQNDALLPTLSSVRGIKPIEYAFGGDFACVLDESNVVYCWGSSEHLGAELDPGVSFAPLHPNLTGATSTALAAGARHACSVQAVPGYRVACWGDGESGQLGDATTPAIASRPVFAFGIDDAVDVTVGDAHTCALRFIVDMSATSPRDVWCWGHGSEGEIGDGAIMSYSIAHQVPLPFNDVAQVRAGSHHTCAIRRSTGEVWCWGRGSEGQLGRGTTPAIGEPARVDGITQAVQLTLGARHSCARLASGNILCWGDNSRAQLGDGTSVMRSSPVLVRSN
ncbi:MAG: hypothetical protein IPK60_08025 [Sandaracinaceae bacterium]|nr:hypothetical protein [Sandaracinaceae bacterium]